MRVRFYDNPVTSRPHVEDHGVSRQECVEVLERPGQDFASGSGARMAYGQTRSGRYLKVVYRADDEGDGVFVITAYLLRGNDLKAYRRRMKR